MRIQGLAVLATMLVGCPAVIWEEELTPAPATVEAGVEPAALVEALAGEAEERREASEILARMGRPAVPALVEALGHEDEWMRVRAALVLARMGPEAIEATDALLVALDDPRPTVRREAARALGALEAPADAVAPALSVALSDPNLGVVEAARRSLVGLGPGAVPDLVEGLESDDVITRFGAISALGELGGASEVAVPGILEALKDPELRVRSRAAWALGRILSQTEGKVDRKGIRLLVKRVAVDSQVEVRHSAATALGEIGPRAAVALPDLEAVLEELEAIPALDPEIAEANPEAAAQAALDLWLAGAVRAALDRIDPDRTDLDPIEP